jgi:2-oxoglutarate dehydrogenase E1 component
MKADWRAHLENEWEVGQSYKPNKADWLDGAWSGLRTADTQDEMRRGKTAVPVKTLKEIGKKLTEVPKGFEVHKTIGRFLENRRQAIETGKVSTGRPPKRWHSALSCSTAIRSGFPARTRARHLLAAPFGALRPARRKPLHPLNNLSPAQAGYEVINSMLSEEAVLGFEYGYSLAEPKHDAWEAQFGDFANGAQVFDQFISSGERKWLRMSGLVCCCRTAMKARGRSIRRRAWSVSCSCARKTTCRSRCTTPSNYFHILRRQLKRDFRKPLILMTPKSLLRHKRAISTLAEMSGESAFHRLLWDDAQSAGPKSDLVRLVKDSKIRRVVCAPARSITTC